MEFYNFKKKSGERETYKDKMEEKLKKIEKLINSELTSKIKKSLIEFFNSSNTAVSVWLIFWELILIIGSNCWEFKFKLKSPRL